MNQEPLNPSGYLRGIHLTLSGTASTGPFDDLFTDPQHKRSWLRRCRVRRCQRPRDHAGQHYRRRWFGRGFSCWGGDEPFRMFTELRRTNDAI